MIFVFERNKGKIAPYPGLSDAEKGLKIQLLSDLRRILMLRGRFYPSDEFIDNWIEWYPEQERNPTFQDKFFDGYFARRANHVMKLSMLMSASRTDSMLVELQDFKRAVRIIERTEIKMPSTFSGMGKLPYADVLEKVMTEVGLRGEVPLDELIWMHRNDVDKWTMERIIDTLRSSNWIRTTNKVGVGTTVHYTKKQIEHKEEE